MSTTTEHDRHLIHEVNEGIGQHTPFTMQTHEKIEGHARTSQPSTIYHSFSDIEARKVSTTEKDRSSQCSTFITPFQTLKLGRSRKQKDTTEKSHEQSAYFHHEHINGEVGREHTPLAMRTEPTRRVVYREREIMR